VLSFLSFLTALFAFAIAFRFKQSGQLNRSRATFVIGCIFVIVCVATGPRSYELIKTLGTMLMPAGALWLIILALLLVAIARRGKADILVMFVVWCLFTIAGNAALGGLLTKSLESRYLGINPFAEQYDVVHVLGGGTAAQSSYEFLGCAGDRVALGARLYQSGNTEFLMTTGSTPPSYEQRHDSAQVTSRIWQSLGVPETAIYSFSSPHDTEDELKLLAELSQENGWTKIGLVTSARHMPRAMSRAEEYGVTVIPLPAAFSGGSNFTGFRSMIPTGAGFAQMHSAMWEYLGRATGQ
jgi:uncharacterized SAM-binding protein YcdF (DUF218 family)